MSKQLITLVSIFLLQTTVFASTVNRNWGAITVKNNGIIYIIGITSL